MNMTLYSITHITLLAYKAQVRLLHPLIFVQFRVGLWVFGGGILGCRGFSLTTIRCFIIVRFR